MQKYLDWIKISPLKKNSTHQSITKLLNQNSNDLDEYELLNPAIADLFKHPLFQRLQSNPRHKQDYQNNHHNKKIILSSFLATTTYIGINITTSNQLNNNINKLLVYNNEEIERNEKIRRLGWFLLFLWILVLCWITKDYWLPICCNGKKKTTKKRKNAVVTKAKDIKENYALAQN